MTPAALALEHLAWCRAQGHHPADVCASVGSCGFDWDDAFDAVLTAALMTGGRPVEAPEPERRLHLRVVG